LVVAAEPITSVDVTSADILAELDKTLNDAGIELYFGELKDPVKDKLKRFELFWQIGDRFFFPTIEAVVSSYLKSHAVDWWTGWAGRTEAHRETGTDPWR
jgi:MFS superfamily sulfate permease-like transporter